MLKVKEQTIELYSADEIPSLAFLNEVPHGTTWKFIFRDSFSKHYVTIGEKMRVEFPDFSVIINSDKPEVTLLKLISRQEIVNNQYFFEQCAKDYYYLAEGLVRFLGVYLKIKKTDFSFPLLTFQKFKQSKKQKGSIPGWEYFFHGFHCRFKNTTTGQTIEVALHFGPVFGVLDPAFFMEYILTTPRYQPLPIQITDKYSDGKRVLDVLKEIGIMDRINSNIEGIEGVVVSHRKKISVTVFPFPPAYNLEKKSFWGDVCFRIRKAFIEVV